MSYTKIMKSPLGPLVISASEKGITCLDFFVGGDTELTQDSAEANCWKNSGTATEKYHVDRAISQLEEYFSGKRTEFDLDLDITTGTDFQQKVWQALTTIPYGETATYKEIAERIGNPKACRAVGGANNKNPIAIVVPCHRVIGSNGKLIGYAGGLSKKVALLEREQR
ncbi:MAG: methylated-DNA--[protein]-cysteine S-methyltransferase [Coriobacteriia bacterium]|nr:methylated-DNA--[protein]-cysteine S-methyltransferase [Coriobacteriia bacterium]